MKVIDAVWEKRNLGVTCTEFTVESGDMVDVVRKTLGESEQQYNVLKIPAGEPQLLFGIADSGYTFVETLINITHDLKEVEVPSIQRRMIDSADYSLMDETDIQHMFDEIKKNIFTTDRIAVDPHFTHEQAANRYIGWISDELQRGCDVFNLIYKNEKIGFFTMKQVNENICFPFLSGIYTDYMKWGMGLNLIYKPIIEVRKRKAKILSTYISSNNKSVIKTHQLFNFDFKEFNYVFVKHQ